MEMTNDNLMIGQIINQINYICPSLGINYVRSPLLKYKYPLATVNIVNNIAHALLYCPRFYTQVLHLMNKMNLPPPFDDNSVPIVNFKSKQRFTEQSSESEMESSKEETYNERPNHSCNAPFKRKTVHRLKTGMVGNKADHIKHKKRKYFQNDYRESLKQSHNHNLKADDIFDACPKASRKANIQINITSDDNRLTRQTLSGTVENFQVNSSGFGLIEARNKRGESESRTETSFYDNREFICDEELESIRLSRSEWKNYSVFNEYESGMPSCRLYLKNIAKQVDYIDLQRIYGKFVNWESEAEKNMFDIRLMKVGRMRGQAFITYHSEHVAIMALNQTNGIVLNGKPIVVVFARSAPPKEIT